MNRWKFVLLLLGTAAVAGLVGRWTGGPNESYAQDAEGAASAPANGASDEDRGWIGLMVEDSPDGLLRAAHVFPGGPSAFGSIRQGDIVLQVAGTKIESEQQLAEVVEQLPPGEETAVVVRRDKKDRSLKVLVGSLREFHGNYAREMMRRDPRDPNYAKFHGVSQADMNTEMFRRLFEQNQRLETSLVALWNELAELRRELKAKPAEGR